MTIICDDDGNILAEAENSTKTEHNPTAHAEMNAIKRLTIGKRSTKFSDLTLISNVQSCPMCFCAAYRSGIRSFIYGSSENDTLVPHITVQELNSFCNPTASIVTGILQDECKKILLDARKSS